MTKFTDKVPGHWDTDEGIDMANQYVNKTRESLAMPETSDFLLANELLMADKTSVQFIHLQQAAKERIRWLSTQLARCEQRLAERTM